MAPTEADIIPKRKQAAQLLRDVIQERLEPRLAINAWPETTDIPDCSLDTAYQALWHFEADEERHQQEMFYLDAQLALLSQMANFLEQGQPIPFYIQTMYLPKQRARFYYPHTIGQALKQFLKLTWQDMASIWRNAWVFLKLSQNGKKPPHS